MKILKAMCAAAVALSLVGCAQTSNSDDKLTKVTLMLDYTPTQTTLVFMWQRHI